MREDTQPGLVKLIGFLVPVVLLAAVFGLAGLPVLEAMQAGGVDSLLLSTVATGLVFAGAGAFLASFLFRGAAKSWNRWAGIVLGIVGALLWLVCIFV
ncbi:hypothetical protein [Leucobacter sp. M11]|uniref:hypothetical protein n=1 Tax=Leucobacter sp. M11 TaxID=2993565 RepID=UPI002D803616|nr:hypothetical protein [Leucobacter sp. M11]MEB4615257.1 hypothetical protein [Leucobacter sp. M11]